MKRKKGLFLAFSGIHGVHAPAKHCIEELKKYLMMHGHGVVEQKSYDFGRMHIAGANSLEGCKFGKSNMADFLRECGGRAELTENVIAPALEAGAIVLCEFFALDSLVNMKRKFEFEDWPKCKDIEEWSRRGVVPTKTFFIDIPPTVADMNLKSLNVNSEGVDVYREMREQYYAEIPKNDDIVIINGDRTEEEIYGMVLKEVKKLL